MAVSSDGESTTPMKRILTTDASLSFLLISLFGLLFVFYPLIDPGTGAGFLLDILTMFVLVSGAYTVSDRRGLLAVTLVMGVVAFALHWSVVAIPSRSMLALRIATMMVFLAIVTGAVLYKVLRKGRITFHRIQGAVAVYLMLGLIWASAYALILIHDPAAFDLGEAEASSLDTIDSQTQTMRRLVYFSFVTMTTLGYGDITPNSLVAGNLAILQALTGQLYVAIIIARLIAIAVSRNDEA